MPPAPDPHRRLFLALLGGGALSLLSPRPLRAITLTHQGHPDPRKGYRAEKVLASDQLGDSEDLKTLFDGVREIPEVVDGIRCHCGCDEWEGMYSLLSCYETRDAMAKWCPICQGQGRLAVRMHGQGKTLDEIRRAIDARF